MPTVNEAMAGTGLGANPALTMTLDVSAIDDRPQADPVHRTSRLQYAVQSDNGRRTSNVKPVTLIGETAPKACGSRKLNLRRIR